MLPRLLLAQPLRRPPSTNCLPCFCGFACPRHKAALFVLLIPVNACARHIEIAGAMLP